MCVLLVCVWFTDGPSACARWRGCCVRWPGFSSRTKSPASSSFAIPFAFPFPTYFLPLCRVSCSCAIRLCINQPFSAIASALEPPEIWHSTHARHPPDIQQPVRARVQAVAGFVVVAAVIAYTACCDVGRRHLYLPDQPARVGLVQHRELLHCCISPPPLFASC